MRIKRRKRPAPDIRLNIPRNQDIQALEVRVIGETEENLGIMKTSDALYQANSQGLDLVLIVPQANPPVVRIISYDKYRYQEEKKIKKQRTQTKNSSNKRVQIGFKAAQNDLDRGAKQINEFLKEGNQVEIVMVLKGREKGKKDFARERLLEFIKANITEPHQIIAPARPGARGLTTMIAPKGGN
ncbi:MAG: translation initiation factor IF-3 [Candidatus Harrisonbacteria bacterium CG10_big_fil_rev_8_21_14_0_10_38_8]|uniref:Translation initiation factor IF-3 n=1 Tax=Candidatus Harrisonbacteria bacterium CG10_big_fil_rev_8_21_14_0_10_38_8 TaxID=1974582 RepID=A0A2M6WJF7_9BACT|nr:MAG: translation initiation factor IF-3 [Candidatus Harrisonbacteria bacterium CG10_big_fil_rev_8_21_14_0_10_38_8]